MIQKNRKIFNRKKYQSPIEKSQNLQVKTVFLNPTGYYMKVKLYLQKDGPGKNYPMDQLPPASPGKPNSRSNDTFVGPYCANTGNNAEFPQSKFLNMF